MKSSRTIRKNINFPESLSREIERYSKELNIDFSKFVRESAEERIAQLKRYKLEKELEEGYKEKAELNLKICEEFKHIDGEDLQ